MAATGTLRKQRGPSPEATRWIYEAMVKPVLLYGSIVWSHKVGRTFQPFIRLQRLAMMCMGTFLRSTPTLGLEIILDFTPLDLLA